MPFFRRRYRRRRGVKRGYKRRRPMRRRRNNRRYFRSVIPRSPFPNVKLVRLKYMGSNQITLTAAAKGVHQFRANSIHDPDSTAVGHQPYYHDTLEALYREYIVLGQKIVVTFYQDELTDHQTVMCGIVQDRLARDFAGMTLTTLESNLKVRYRRMGLYQSSGRNRCTVVSKFSLKRDFGIKDWKDQWYEYGANFGANVSSHPWWYTAFVIDPQNQALTLDVKFDVTIYYICALRLRDEVVYS